MKLPRWEFTHEAMDQIIITAEIKDQTEDNEPPPYFWLSSWTINRVEKLLRKQKTIPRFCGHSHFEDDRDMVVYLLWPFYYKRSWKQRFRQMRFALNGKWASFNAYLENKGL